MKKGTSSKKALILLLLLSLALCVPYYVVFSDIKSKNEHISELEHELSLSSQKQQYAVFLQEAVKAAQSDIDLLNNSIIPSGSDGNVGFIENLENTAHNNGLEISIESLNEENKKEFASSTVNVLNVSAKTKGSWEGTYRFVKEIEALPFKVTVSNFALEGTVNNLAADNKKSPHVWQSSFEIRVLKYK